jgi:hypothetical protein
MVEVLDFVLFLEMRRAKSNIIEAALQESAGATVLPRPASHLGSLTNLVAWDDDAVEAVTIAFGSTAED